MCFPESNDGERDAPCPAVEHEKSENREQCDEQLASLDKDIDHCAFLSYHSSRHGLHHKIAISLRQ